MTPAHPPRRKGSKARSWKAWAVVSDHAPWPHGTYCLEGDARSRAYPDLGQRVIPVLITEQLPRPGSRRGGRKGKR